MQESKTGRYFEDHGEEPQHDRRCLARPSHQQCVPYLPAHSPALTAAFELRAARQPPAEISSRAPPHSLFLPPLPRTLFPQHLISSRARRAVSSNMKEMRRARGKLHARRALVPRLNRGQIEAFFMTCSLKPPAHPPPSAIDYCRSASSSVCASWSSQVSTTSSTGKKSRYVARRTSERRCRCAALDS